MPSDEATLAFFLCLALWIGIRVRNYLHVGCETESVSVWTRERQLQTDKQFHYVSCCPIQSRA